MTDATISMHRKQYAYEEKGQAGHVTGRERAYGNANNEAHLQPRRPPDRTEALYGAAPPWAKV